MNDALIELYGTTPQEEEKVVEGKEKAAKGEKQALERVKRN